jgi:hypothetical protein
LFVCQIGQDAVERNGERPLADRPSGGGGVARFKRAGRRKLRFGDFDVVDGYLSLCLVERRAPGKPDHAVDGFGPGPNDVDGGACFEFPVFPAFHLRLEHFHSRAVGLERARPADRLGGSGNREQQKQ